MINRIGESPNNQRIHNLKTQKRTHMNNLNIKEINHNTKRQIIQSSSNKNQHKSNKKSKEQKVKQLIAQKYRAFNRDKLALYLKDLKGSDINLNINQLSSCPKEPSKQKINIQSNKFQLIPNITVYPFDTGDAWITYTNSIYAFKDNVKTNNFNQQSWMNKVKEKKHASHDKVIFNQNSQLYDKLVLEQRSSREKKRNSLPSFLLKRKGPVSVVNQMKNKKLHDILLNKQQQQQQNTQKTKRKTSLIIFDSKSKIKNPQQNLSFKFRKTMQNPQNRYLTKQLNLQKQELVVPQPQPENLFRKSHYHLSNAELSWFPSQKNRSSIEEKFVPILNLNSKLNRVNSKSQAYGYDELGSQIDLKKIKIQPW